MIALFTDYSVTDPYVGLMKMAIHQWAPDCKLVDVCHDLPMFNPNASGRLLQMLVNYLPAGSIILAVVDPGVGTARHALWLEVDGKHYLGPDNGLLARIVNQGQLISAHIIEYDANEVSTSFHGRDVFAPAAAQIELGNAPASRSMDASMLIGREWPAELAEIIYIDHYGNVMTGINGAQVSANTVFRVNEAEFEFQKTFQNKGRDKPFWYVNSIGLIEFAHYGQSIAGLYHFNVGDRVSLVSC